MSTTLIRKMVTMTMPSLLSFIAFAGHIASQEFAFAAADEAASASSTMLLPAVRRVGMDRAKSNLDEFRNFMQKQSRDLSGVAAQPYSQKEFEQELNAMSDAVFKETGRFWMLTLEATDSITGSKNPATVRERLQKTYDLDAWIATDVSFRPDSTRLRVLLQNSQGTRIFIREDVVTSTQASMNDLKIAMQSAASRFISTLWHDARVTFVRDDLMTIDAGTERGLTKGTQVSAGFVTLSALHPQTGEYLRAKRNKTHTLEVIDSRRGAALCRIKSVNNVALSEIKTRVGTPNPPLLAWLASSESQSETDWRNPKNPELEPITGTSDMGFATKSNSSYIPPPTPPVGEGYGPAQQQFNGGYPDPYYPQQPTQMMPQQQPAPDAVQPQPYQQTEQTSQYNGGPIWNDPSSWRLVLARGGGGLTLGVLDGLDDGKETRNGGYTSPWLGGYAVMDIGNQMSFEAGLNYSLFMDAVDGSTYGLTSVVQLPVLNAGGGRLDVGGGLGIYGGEAKTKLLELDDENPIDLARFEILARADYTTHLEPIGRLRTTIDLSLFEIAGLGGKYQIEVSEASYLPRPLTMNMYFVNYPSPSAKNKKLGWWELGLGAMWTFIH